MKHSIQKNIDQSQEQKEKNFSSLDEVLTCPCCLLFIQDPYSPPCGHSFCKCCIEDENKCPLCRVIIPFNKKTKRYQISRNYVLKDLLEQIPLLKCCSECTWSTYEQKKHQKHLNECKFVQKKMIIIDRDQESCQFDARAIYQCLERIEQGILIQNQQGYPHHPPVQPFINNYEPQFGQLSQQINPQQRRNYQFFNNNFMRNHIQEQFCQNIHQQFPNYH